MFNVNVFFTNAAGTIFSKSEWHCGRYGHSFCQTVLRAQETTAASGTHRSLHHFGVAGLPRTASGIDDRLHRL